MPRVPDSKLQLIAVELGAPWPEWLAQSATSPRRVITEMEGETPAVFAGRVAEELAREHLALGSAVLVCNARADAAQMEARRSVVQALLGASIDKKGPFLTIIEPEESGERLERALSALAGELGRRAVLRGGAAETDAGTVSRVASVA